MTSVFHHVIVLTATVWLMCKCADFDESYQKYAYDVKNQKVRWHELIRRHHHEMTRPSEGIVKLTDIVGGLVWHDYRQQS